MKTSINKTARFAGLLYLILIITGIINFIYIPSKLIDWESASITFENISNSKLLFQWGILFGIIAFLAFILLPLALFKLLLKVNKTHAWLMVVFALISVPLSFSNMNHKLSILTLLKKSEYFSLEQLQNQVMLHLEYFNNGVHLSSIFWGVWLFPFGYLVYKSDFLPKILGVFLMIGCFCYLGEFIGVLFVDNYYNTIISQFLTIPAAIGEIGTCLWLIIMGTNKISLKKQISIVEK